MRNRVVLALAGAVCLAAVPGISAYARQKNAAHVREFQKQLAGDQKILQALNRLTYGPRPISDCLAAVPGISAYARQKNAAHVREFQKQLAGDQKILQALNRLTYGPRP